MKDVNRERSANVWVEGDAGGRVFSSREDSGVA